LPCRPPARRWRRCTRRWTAGRFAAWLDTEGLDDPHLRTYLDYCCRDDFGAGTATVSAWAGIHYFASRHGFHAPGDDDGADPARDAVLTWPEGNGWLTQRLAAPLGARLRTGQVVLRIEDGRHGVRVDALDTATGRTEALAGAAVRGGAAGVCGRACGRPAARSAAPGGLPHHLRAVAGGQHRHRPPAARPSWRAAPAWDNVIHGSTGLGYVDASHQALDPRPGPTVLTWYHAPGLSPTARAHLLDAPWTHWRDMVLGELSQAHADLPEVATQVDITRYGHAMAVPLPGERSAAAARVSNGGPLRFAHSDWSGYSVFEEAFTRGHLAGMARSGA
jgi:hypothetical protein